jgi:hypothetical protein
MEHIIIAGAILSFLLFEYTAKHCRAKMLNAENDKEKLIWGSWLVFYFILKWITVCFTFYKLWKLFF